MRKVVRSMLILIVGGALVGGCLPWPFSTMGRPEEVFWDDYPNFREVMPGEPPEPTTNPAPWDRVKQPASRLETENPTNRVAEAATNGQHQDSRPGCPPTGSVAAARRRQP